MNLNVTTSQSTGRELDETVRKVRGLPINLTQQTLRGARDFFRGERHRLCIIRGTQQVIAQGLYKWKYSCIQVRPRKGVLGPTYDQSTFEGQWSTSLNGNEFGNPVWNLMEGGGVNELFPGVNISPASNFPVGLRPGPLSGNMPVMVWSRAYSGVDGGAQALAEGETFNYLEIPNGWNGGC